MELLTHLSTKKINNRFVQGFVDSLKSIKNEST